MTTDNAKETLSRLRSRLDYMDDLDPYDRATYKIAIDSALTELKNYEKLLEELIDERKEEIVNLGHKIQIQSMQYKIFKEGGDLP